MKDLWHYEGLSEPISYGCNTTYLNGMGWLEDDPSVDLVEDWGCGACYAERFLQRARYVGIDGSPSPWTSRIEDLTTYRSDVPAIFIRHVLEHNVEWARILDNAVASFRKRMALVIFTPFATETGQVAGSINGNGVPDLAFRHQDLVDHLGDSEFFCQFFATETQYGQECIFFIKK